MSLVYKSLEQRAFDALPSPVRSPIPGFVQWAGSMCYGTASLAFRIPTFVRKFLHDQTVLSRAPRRGFTPLERAGAWAGILGGGALVYAFLGDVPVELLFGANAASLVYETSPYIIHRTKRHPVSETGKQKK